MRFVLLALAAVLGAAPAVAQPVDPALVRKGERVFQHCYSCHSVDPQETGLPGPNLAGVIGRRAAAEKGFDYSQAMRTAADRGLVWRTPDLDRFLADPFEMMPRTEMSFVGLKSAEDRRAVIAYLAAHPRRQ